MSSFRSALAAAGLAGVISALSLAPAFADAADDKAAITARLEAWADAFNARDAIRTCDLFSADLVSTMRGRPDEGRDAVADASRLRSPTVISRCATRRRSRRFSSAAISPSCGSSG